MSYHIYKNKKALASDECSKIIDEFHQQTWFLQDGIIFGADAEHPNDKVSTDCTIYGFDYHTSLYSALDEGIKNYLDMYSEACCGKQVNITRAWNIQWYKPGEGFNAWHSEYHPDNNRNLAWMINLNNVKNGGQTEFKHIEECIEPLEGQLSIWPAYFTHEHRGVQAPEEDKYIATGWLQF